MVNPTFVLVITIVFISFSRIICCTTIVTTQTFLIVFGFWLTEVVSMLCVSSVILALIFNIFIIEYGYIFIVRTLNLKNDEHQQKQTNNIDFPEIIEKAEIQREVLLNQFGPHFLRKPFMRYYHKLKDEDIKVSVVSQ